MNYVSELKIRNIYRIAFAYLALTWVKLQIPDVVIPALGLPEMIMTMMATIGIIGFPFAVFFAWVFDPYRPNFDIGPWQMGATPIGQWLIISSISLWIKNKKY